jgi:hypothetical protein
MPMIDCIISWLAPNIMSMVVGGWPGTPDGRPTTSTPMTMSARPGQPVKRHRVEDAAVNHDDAVEHHRPEDGRYRGRCGDRLAQVPLLGTDHFGSDHSSR